MLAPDALPIPGGRRIPYRVLVAGCLLLAVLAGRGCAALVDRSSSDRSAVAPPAVITSFDGRLTDLVPGDARRGEIQVRNPGAAGLGAAVAAHSAARNPDLTSMMEIDVWAAPDNGCAGAPGPLLYSGLVNTMRVAVGSLPAAAGDISHLCFELRLPVPVGNQYQGTKDDLGFAVDPSAGPR